MPKGSLVIVGSGIKAIAQCTFEAKGYIESADIVFVLASDTISEKWIGEIAKQTESLSDCYEKASNREVVYQLMTQRILNAVRDGNKVCAVFYGHPGMFVRPAHDSITQARLEGFSAKMVPGISSLDCLFSDLGVDPAQHGLQSYSASDFFLRDPNIENGSSLVLWQVGVFAERSHFEHSTSAGKIKHLVSALLQHYPAKHRICLYEAATYVVAKPRIEWLELEQLALAGFSQASTLFLPALELNGKNRNRLRVFEEITLLD